MRRLSSERPNHHRQHGVPRRRRALAAAASAALVLGLVTLSASTPATAAGNGVLGLTMKPVDASNGNTLITDAQNGNGPAGYASGNTITYLVQYSCGTAPCDNTQVQLSTPPADPNGLLPAGQFILQYDSFAAGTSGATIGGTDASGKLVDLGDLAAGSSGTFSVTYTYQATRNKEVPNGSFYPDGSKITMSADITSDTGTAPKHANASDVTWHLDDPNGSAPYGPAAALGPGGTFRTDETVNLQVAVDPGNMVVNPGSNVAGSADRSAVGNYTFVYHVPEQATIEAVNLLGDPDPDAVIDNVNHTVTWTKGSTANPVYGARGGWGLAAISGFNSGGAALNNGVDPDTQAFWAARQVQVSFDGTQFPGADADGCNFPTADIQTSLDASVTFLDNARTTKTIDDQKMNAKVACVTPFGGLAVDKDVAGGGSSQFAFGDGNLGGTGGPGDTDVYATNVPAPGESNLERTWRVTVANLGNVPGVAIIDEPDLVQDHLKVRQIYPSGGYGASVEWTAEDGTGATTSGTTVLTNTEKLNAPSGAWFVSAKATTDPIDPGRVLPTDNTQSLMFMNYLYGVDDGAIPFIGEERVNTAHVTMTYPGYGDGRGEEPIVDLLGDPLTTDPAADAARTVRYTQPTPQLLAGFASAPVAAGGAPLNAIVPGTEVTWQVNGSTDNVWPDTQITPQLMYVAPAGWDIVPGSAAMSDAAPPGVTVTYGTKTIDGVTRDIVVATWPGPVTPSTTIRDYFGTMTVTTKPSPTAPAGTQSVPMVVAGDASGNWSRATGAAYLDTSHDFRAATNGITDGDDLDSDDNTDESFARTNSAFDVRVTALPALDVTKEICDADTDASDGCNWVKTGATDPVEVPDDSDIKYRVTLKNTGNVNLTGAVAEDVLPYDGDSRGSQFDQTLTGTEATNSGLDLDYSTSTDPGSGDWGGTESGARAVRLQAADLAIGDSVSTVITAAAGDGANAGEVGCNALKVQSDQTISTTTSAVCARLFSVAPPAPSLGLLKSDNLDDANDNGVADVGEKITYTFTASNTGNVDVDDVSIVDDMLSDAGVDVTPANADIAANGQATFTSAPYTVTQADVDAGEVANTATAEGTFGGDDVSSQDATASTPTPDREPSLTIEKSSEFTTDNGTADKADKDDVLKYSFLVENTGNVTLTGVTVDDVKVGSVAPGPVTLVPGDSQLFTGSYTVTQDDVNTGQVYNIATAKGTSPLGALESAPDDDRVDGLDPDPLVTITKSADITTDNGESGKADKGDVITYTFTVHNAGPATAYGVSVDDPLSGLSAISPGPVATLEPGDDAVFTATYTVKQSDVDAGEVSNQATASYTPPDTDPDDGVDPPEVQTPPSDLVVVPAADPDPSLEIVKSSQLNDTNDNGVADVGETIDYSFDAANTGNVTLVGVHVVDPRVSGLDPASATLGPDEHQVFTADPYEVTQADVDAGEVLNSAVAKGNVTGGPETTSSPDENRVQVPDADPKLTIVKHAVLDDKNGNGTADKGEEIVYSFNVTNDGNVTMSDVTVHDARIAGLVPDSIDFLAPKDSVQFTADPYVVTAKDVRSGKITNTATASATPPSGPDVTSPEDTVTTKATPSSGVGSGDGGGSLPDTGGLPLGWLVAALGLLASGAVAVNAKKRMAGKHAA
jgi:uncharacterized repeat protein (TIGR01451 family)